MTLGTQVTLAERRARVTSAQMRITADSEATRTYINEGVREFAKRVNGVPKETYLALTPKFDVFTHFAIRLTITGGANAVAAQDMAIAATNHTDMGGASLAAYLGGELSNNLAVSVSVSWDTTSWEFTLYDEAAACSYIEIGAPETRTYADFSEMLFNQTGTQSGTYFTGDVPLDCTVEVNLPDDFLEIEWVEWDQDKLDPAPYDLFISPGSAGTPRWYGIKNKRLRLAPYPEEQELLHIRYKHMPDDLAVDASEDTETCPLPSETHMAPVYFASASIAAENEDDEIYKRDMGMFLDMIRQYRLRENNQTPTLFPKRRTYWPIKVEVPSN